MKGSCASFIENSLDRSLVFGTGSVIVMSLLTEDDDNASFLKSAN